MEYIIEGSRWVGEEVEILQKMWAKAPKEEILKKLNGRSWRSIHFRAQLYHFKRKKIQPNAWSIEEIKLLKLHFATTGTEDLMKIINRSHKGICAMASKLNIRRGGRAYSPKKSHVRFNDWTEKELLYIDKHYSTSSKKELLRFLSNRTWGAIIRQANVYGLKRNNAWSEGEENKIMKYYRIKSKEQMLKLIPKRSWERIKKRWFRLNYQTKISIVEK